ncbi:acyl-CoA dehydrogenase [Sphingobacterium sp. HJSM2_6]|uniref:acyl-CoA dehydrogenase n=1 Tax=Sphingobacterium sp. HJSM2_6 TaxID=3366264 RepID=UPI003BCDCD78
MFTLQEIENLKNWQSLAIANKSLTQEQLSWLYTHKWFNLWVPIPYNGLELSLVDGLNRLEELAYRDGGLAWTVTLCSGANMFVGFINQEFATKLWENPQICLGGSGQIAGKADWNGESYILSGFWKYATGSPHLTHFTLNAPIYHAGIPQWNAEGEALVRSFVIPREHVLLHYDWNSMGLECTASHSFSIDRLVVDEKNTFQLVAEAKTNASPIFDIPFISFAEMTLTVNYLGMYRRFLDLMEKYLFEKSKVNTINQDLIKKRFSVLDQKQVKFLSDKTQLMDLFMQAWNNAVSAQFDLNIILYQRISADCRKIVSLLYEDLNELFPWTGIRGIQMDEELNIVYRNLLTARQHALLQD